MSSSPTDRGGARPRMIVIGAGPMGLAAAHHALKRGFDVDVIEAGDRVGGMAAHFDFDGLSIERFYHFCCLGDVDTLELLDELGLHGAMRWVSTTMGFYVDGTFHKWGDPFALLSFPKLGPLGKLRYGLHALISMKRNDWSRLDAISAPEWLEAWLGRKVYDKMWRRLLELKFHELTGDLSAAWIWRRMKRLGASRRSLFEERLGYIEGGSETLMNALADAVAAAGGRIHLSAPAARVLIEDGAARGVRTRDGRTFHSNHVFSTVPTPAALELLADAPAEVCAPYEKIRNIGVVCVVLKLARQVTPHFWVNVSDPEMPIPGLIEFSNLRPLEKHVVYVPYYMPTSNPKFSMDDEAFVRECMACLKRINPSITEEDLLSARVGRLAHAQPVCEVGFAGMIPPVQTPVRDLTVADTCFYYPEDRGVSESVRFAKETVDAIAAARATRGAQ